MSADVGFSYHNSVENLTFNLIVSLGFINITISTFVFFTSSYIEMVFCLCD